MKRKLFKGKGSRWEEKKHLKQTEESQLQIIRK